MPTTAPVRSGERVSLNLLREDDLPLLDAWFWASDPARQTCRPVPAVNTAGPRLLREPTPAPPAIGGKVAYGIRRSEDDRLLGRVRCFDWNPRNGACEIGFLLDPARRGRGYAREAVALLLDHAFETFQARKVMAQTGAFNHASLRLLEALGFQLDGRLRRHHVLADGVHDDLVMSLLREEHRAGPGETTS